MARDWTVIKITIPGRYKRVIQDETTGRKRAPNAEEIEAGGHAKTPDRVGLLLVTLAELPALKARLEKHGRKVEDAFPEGKPAKSSGGEA